MVGEILPMLPLIALLVFLLLFVFRLLMQVRRGNMVFVRDRQRTLSQKLTDQVFLVVFVPWGACIVGFATGLAQRLGFPPGIVLFDGLWWRLGGGVLMGVGLIIYGLALRSFGDSWRVGIDREKSSALVTAGIYGRSRNPIYLGLLILFFGTFVFYGRLVFLICFLFLAAGVHLTIMREEKFLKHAYGTAYGDYCQRVPRYLFW